MDFQKTVRDKIKARINDLGFETNLGQIASPWVGMNILSLDPETAIVDERQTSLMKLLERNRVTPVPLRIRHPYTFGGSIHCATLDTVRDSKPESYFD